MKKALLKIANFFSAIKTAVTSFLSETLKFVGKLIAIAYFLFGVLSIANFAVIFLSAASDKAGQEIVSLTSIFNQPWYMELTYIICLIAWFLPENRRMYLKGLEIILRWMRKGCLQLGNLLVFISKKSETFEKKVIASQKNEKNYLKIFIADVKEI